MLAFEISRQLRKQGTRVKGIILIDSPHPVSHDPLPTQIISHIAASMPTRSKAAEQLKESIEAQFHRNASLLANYNPLPSDTDDTVPCIMLKCKQTFDSVGLCGVWYPWVCDEASRQQSVKVWESLVGKPITVLEVEGDHFSLFNSQNVRALHPMLVTDAIPPSPFHITNALCSGWKRLDAVADSLRYVMRFYMGC